MAKALFELVNAAAHYQTKPRAITNVNLSIAVGSFTMLVGPNGSGKSTIIKVLTRELKLAHGAAYFDGALLSQVKALALAKKVAYVGQMNAAPLGLRVREFMLQARYPHQHFWKRPSAQDFQLVSAAAATCQISHLLSAFVTDLSGGQWQKVLIAAAIVQGTDIIILDEPTTFLDLKAQQEVLSILAMLHASGKTIIAVVHDLNQALKFATHVIVTRGGSIIASGAPDTTLTAPLIQAVFGVVPLFSNINAKRFISDVMLEE